MSIGTIGYAWYSTRVTDMQLQAIRANETLQAKMTEKIDHEQSRVYLFLTAMIICGAFLFLTSYYRWLTRYQVRLNAMMILDERMKKAEIEKTKAELQKLIAETRGIVFDYEQKIKDSKPPKSDGPINTA